MVCCARQVTIQSGVLRSSSVRHRCQYKRKGGGVCKKVLKNHDQEPGSRLHLHNGITVAVRIERLLGLSEYMRFVELKREQKKTIVVRTDAALVESEMV